MKSHYCIHLLTYKKKPFATDPSEYTEHEPRGMWSGGGGGGTIGLYRLDGGLGKVRGLQREKNVLLLQYVCAMQFCLPGMSYNGILGIR